MIALGSDQVGLLLKREIIKYLDAKGIKYMDFGTYTEDRVNYSEYGLKAAKAVADGACEKGILFCGTGIGIGIVANKVKGIRCVCCSDCYSAKLSREHNDTNMLALGYRVVGPELAKMIVDEWLNASYDGGIHQIRLNHMKEIEEFQEIRSNIGNTDINNPT